MGGERKDTGKKFVKKKRREGTRGGGTEAKIPEGTKRREDKGGREGRQ